jgi:hypothetical protein
VALVEPIRIEGLKEFTRAVKHADASLPKAVRLAGNRAANVVVRAAVPRVPVGPPAGGHARNSIKARSTRTEVRITAGGSRFPYYPWLDFGGRVGRKKSVSRPFLKRGRYIWAAYYEHQAEVQTALEESLSEVARSAGLEVI